MSTFVLVHGAWHGAWCWQKVIALLAAQGHKVIAPDLPGSGQDDTALDEISLKAYANCIGEIIDQQQEKVILVGHSMGGMVITQVAEDHAEQLQCLVYLSAFLPRNGESLLYLAEKLPDGLVNPNMLPSADGLSLSVKEEIIESAFYAQCSRADIEMAKGLIKPQATAPLTSAVRISDEKFGKVAKVYITCTQDQALPPQAQEMMYSSTPCGQLIAIDADHSPFFSAAETLAGHLQSL